MLSLGLAAILSKVKWLYLLNLTIIDSGLVIEDIAQELGDPNMNLTFRSSARSFKYICDRGPGTDPCDRGLAVSGSGLEPYANLDIKFWMAIR